MSKPRNTVATCNLNSNAYGTDHVKVNVTSAPHHDGDPNHEFFEAWFVWTGGSLRTSDVFHDRVARDHTINFINDICADDHSDRLDDLFDQYQWDRDV